MSRVDLDAIIANRRKWEEFVGTLLPDSWREEFGDKAASAAFDWWAGGGSVNDLKPKSDRK